MRRTPAENINLPPALLSRFDLLWLILDRADMETDLEMARHIVHVHQNLESPALGFTPLEPSVLRQGHCSSTHSDNALVSLNFNFIVELLIF
jgi:DNA replication licensing factor MCM7